MIIQYLFPVLVLFFVAPQINAEACTKDDLTFAYTECSDNMRWRVQVPKTQCTADSVAFPSVGLRCNFTCPAGNYLDIEKSECTPCPPGRYSLGSGLRYDTFRTLPPELKSTVELLGDSVNVTCKGAGWLPKGDFIAGKPDSRCAVKLTLTVNLAVEGHVAFRYQYRRSDALFMFDVQNDRCESLPDPGPGPWMEETEQGEVGTRTTRLRMGLNVLRWTLVAPIMPPDSAAGYLALIHSVEVTGLPFVYSCQACRPGWYSSVSGQAFCHPCPRDLFSPGEGVRCRPCPESEFAPPGSAACQPRPPCRVSEPWQGASACDPAAAATSATTRLEYRWVQPQVCRETPDGARLPAPGPSEPCSAAPCHPGAAYDASAGVCRPCPAGHFSPDASGVCRPCPANTQPRRELLVTDWLLGPAALGPLVGVTCHATAAMSAKDAEIACPGGGWVWSRRWLRTAAARAAATRVVQVDLAGGLLSQTSDLFGKQTPGHAGELRIEFETECSMPCQLALFEQSNSRGSSQRRRWSNSQGRQNYTYKINSQEPVIFQLVFETAVLVDPTVAREKATADHLTLYTLSVTNVNGSGAVDCVTCPMGLKGDKCIPCMPGHYYESSSNLVGGVVVAGNSTEDDVTVSAVTSAPPSSAVVAGGAVGGTCLPCPSGTRVVRHPAVGVTSCAPCPPGLRPVGGGTACNLEPRPRDPDGRTIDLTPLLRVPGPGHGMTVQSGRMFAMSGAQYSHLYNLSLSGDAVCEANATKLATRVSRSYLCRGTLVPGRGAGPASVLMPTSLADRLLNASQMPRRQTDARLIAEGFGEIVAAQESAARSDHHHDAQGPRYDHEIWLASDTSGATEACPQGRLTRVTLRCEPSVVEDILLLPPACPSGTCDGCEFRILMLGRRGCPLCRRRDFDRIRGECHFGQQIVHLFAPKYCFEPDGRVPDKRTETAACEIVGGPILVLLCTLLGVGIFSFLLACYCCRKNQALRYKYTQLIEATEGDTSGASPLGAAESCAVHDGEEDDADDADDVDKGGAAPQKSAASVGFARFLPGRGGRRRADDKVVLMEPLGDVDL